MPTQKTKQVNGDAVRLVQRPSTDQEETEKVYFVTVNGSRVLGPLFPRSYALQRFDDVVERRQPSSSAGMSDGGGSFGPIDSYKKEVVTNDQARSDAGDIRSPLDEFDADPIGDIDPLADNGGMDTGEKDVLERFDNL